MSAEDENLKVFYRSMTTEQLIVYRGSLTAATKNRAKRAFAETRRRLVAEVLQERGVEALN